MHFPALLALRAIEAIRSNICYAHTNVKIVANYAGVSDYKDGPTHHSITDIAIFALYLKYPDRAGGCHQTATFVPFDR
jgi:transketolase C-terminal domain/subunit